MHPRFVFLVLLIVHDKSLERFILDSIHVESILADELLSDPRLSLFRVEHTEERIKILLKGFVIQHVLIIFLSGQFCLQLGKASVEEREESQVNQWDKEQSARRDLSEQLFDFVIGHWIHVIGLDFYNFIPEDLLVRERPNSGDTVENWRQKQDLHSGFVDFLIVHWWSLVVISKLDPLSDVKDEQIEECNWE